MDVALASVSTTAFIAHALKRKVLETNSEKEGFIK